MAVPSQGRLMSRTLLGLAPVWLRLCDPGTLFSLCELRALSRAFWAGDVGGGSGFAAWRESPAQRDCLCRGSPPEHRHAPTMDVLCCLGAGGARAHVCSPVPPWALLL